ncbi:hypothetical protein SLEP1_g45 [Rubroshorea leprosula]|uniref:CTLH domain-containing protein n=1 Tax=Rubroshorea leprosula TaxID=152421 RepID=A0AAV5HHZ3_9ROSI|nr:hypothetical protein SLEP1_g45 [Rubroshorea leprosula]
MSSLSRELVFLILQFLEEEKFKETVHKLEQESGFFFNIKYFEEKALAGEWDDVEKYLSGFTKVDDNRYSMKIYFEIRKQKYLEALDRHDRPKAVEILAKDLKVFSSFNEELYKEITQLLTLENFSLNWQHQLCKNPRPNPDIKTLFTDHSCSPSNGARAPTPVTLPIAAVAKPTTYAPLGAHGGPFPPATAASNSNALAGWMLSANPSSSVQSAVVAASSLSVPPNQGNLEGFDFSYMFFWLVKDPSHWDVAEPLPSYGRGIELPGKRHRSLINGYMLNDVVITGDNGTIDGQGSVWWDWFTSHSLNYSRPHLVEFISSEKILVSNITFRNAPAYNIHPVYCSDVYMQNVSVFAPPGSPYTVGVVPDSSNNVCIEDCNISMGHDAIALKSGWDEYGIAYGRPTTNVNIRRVHLQSFSGASIAFGSEMSGGISNIQVKQVHLYNSLSGIELRTTRGRGGYIKEIITSDVDLRNVNTAFGATGHCRSHPDDKFDPDALPIVDKITFQNIIGTNITVAGNFTGIEESPFTSICLSNISLSMNPASSTYWECSYVSGFSESVFPEPCPCLENSNTSSTCFSLLNSNGRSAVL